LQDDPVQITHDQIKLAEVGRQTTVDISSTSVGRRLRGPSLTHRSSGRTARDLDDNDGEGERKTVVFHLNEHKK